MLARRHLLAHFIVVAAGAVGGHVIVGGCISSCIASAGRWEERPSCPWSLAAFGTHTFVLRLVESGVLGIVSARRARSDPRDVRCVRCVAVLPLNWFHGGVVQVDDQVLVDRVLVWRLRVADRLHNLVHSPCLGATVIGRDSVILGVLLVILKVDTFVLSCIVLNCVVVY